MSPIFYSDFCFDWKGQNFVFPLASGGNHQSSSSTINSLSPISSDQMTTAKQYSFYHTLERYVLAVQSLAYPLPQGCSSFFAYLGYRALDHSMFMQYVQRHVFELQIDVMKAILTDIDDSDEGIRRKLTLLALLPRSRARRLLNKWNHPASVQIRARDHAMNILSGAVNKRPSIGALHTMKARQQQPMKEKIGPLDTFLDLLTAKASLNEIDFNLIIDATVNSLDNIRLEQAQQVDKQAK